jgi:hypothetical protein
MFEIYSLVLPQIIIINIIIIIVVAAAAVDLAH